MKGGGRRSVGCQREVFFQTVARDLNWKSVKDHEDMATSQKVPTGSDDTDRFNHDVANLLVLPFLCFLVVKAIEELDVWNVNHAGVKGLTRNALPKPPCWWWHLCNASFTAYMMLDALWIFLRPRSVRSSAVIFCHHFVTCFGYIMSYSYLEGPLESRWRRAMLAGSMVEVNTWFLLARRTLTGKWSIISVLFYVTWCYHRLYVNLTQTWDVLGFFSEDVFYTLDQNSDSSISTQEWRQFWMSLCIHKRFWWALYGVFTACTLMYLNIKWTYDLIMVKIRHFRGKSKKKEEKCL